MRTDIEIPRIEAIAERLRAEFPELADDEVLRFDTLDGEAPVSEVLRHIVREMAVADAFASGLAGMIEDMGKRKDRFVNRVSYCRAMIERVMAALDVSKITLPEATLSIRPGPPKVVIGAENELPAEFFRHEIRPNLSAIRDALKAGTAVPGASLSNGAPSLSVRMS